MKELLIVGAGGHGRCCLEIAKSMQKYESYAFLDDQLVGEEINGIAVIGTIDEMSAYYGEYEDIFIAIGNNEKRKKLFRQAKEIGFCVPSLIHPLATLLNADVDEGTVVFPGVVIEPQAQIGKGCILDANVVIGHDAKLEDFVLVYANTTIGANAYIGSITKIDSNECIPQNTVSKTDYSESEESKDIKQTYSFEAGV